MRSSILLSSALAIGAIATPILDKRYYVTEVDLEIKTVTVYVTPGAPEPTAAAIPSYGQRHGHSHKPYSKSKAPAPSSIAAPKPSEVYTPPPAYTPAPTPVQSSKPAPVPSAPAAPVSSAPAAPIGSHKSGPEQAKFSSGPDYEAMVLYHHNAIRANHGAEPLTWSDECAAAALWSANQCEFKHQWEHPDMNMGQNIFTTSGNAFNVSGGIVESWYKGEMAAMAPYYGVANLNDKPVFHEVGHLTALVWKGTSKVGCASVNCAGKKSDSTIASMNMFTVCNYQDPGNMQDQYAKNVQAPISTSNLPQWDD